MKVKKEVVFAYGKGIGIVLVVMFLLNIAAKLFFNFTERVEPENCGIAIGGLTAFLIITSVLWTKHKLS